MVKEGLADEMPALVRDMGLILDNIHAPFWDHHLLWSGSQDMIEQIQKELEVTLLFCAKHHIPKVVAHLATGYKMPPSSSGMQVIRNLVTSAENLGVIIAIENTEIAKERYARGEITKEQFEQIKKDLKD